MGDGVSHPHWHFFGGVLVAVGTAIFGVAAAIDATASTSTAWCWVQTPTIVAYALIASGFLCGFAAARDAPFTLRRVPSLALGVLLSVPRALWYPFRRWGPIRVMWRGFHDHSRAAASGWMAVFAVHEALYGTAVRRVDITERVRAQIVDGALDFVMDNDFAGTDPAPGEEKYLWLRYSAGKLLDHEVVFEEYDPVRLP